MNVVFEVEPVEDWCVRVGFLACRGCSGEVRDGEGRGRGVLGQSGRSSGCFPVSYARY